MSTSTTAPAALFIPVHEDGRLWLRLELPAGSAELDQVYMSDPNDLPLPDLVIDIDVAALQRILSVFWEFQQHLYALSIPLGMTSAEFGGKLKLARLRLCPYVDDRAILSACFTNEWSGTEYALDIGQYLPVAVDRNLACYLAQLRQSPA